MWEELIDIWESLRVSFWFVPACIVAGALLLAPVFTSLDQRVFSSYDSKLFWLFGGKADAARSLLSIIASSLITVVAVAFSVTLVAIQQAASQYSPRILRNFTADRVNQVILGTYIATFAFALIVLSNVRSEPHHSASIAGAPDLGFVPALSVMVTMLMALVSLGMLVYFFHHVTLSLQVSTILGHIRAELDEELARDFPMAADADGDGDDDYDTKLARLFPALGSLELTEIHGEKEGYIKRYDQKRLMDLTAAGPGGLVCLPRQIGDYILPRSPIARVWSRVPLKPELAKQILETIRIGPERTIAQDPLFALRQIVDIAVKALSPGVNDPTTAEECITSLKGAVARIAHRWAPPPLVSEQHVHYLTRAATFAEVVERCFSQIRANSRSDVHVQRSLVFAFEELGLLCPTEARRDVFRQQLQGMLDELEDGDLIESDRALLRERARDAIAKINAERERQWTSSASSWSA